MPDLSYLLGPRGTVRAIGHEDGPEPPTFGIARYRSPEGSYRYVYYVNGIPVSALQVMTRDKKHGRVANVWTAPEDRRHGYATMLLRQARKDFKTVEHSDDMSPDAVAWKGRVGESYETHEELTFASGGDALYRGQWDGWIIAYDKTGRQLGQLDWQSWGHPGDDEPSYRIKLIEVLPEYRRRGIATALYRELFRQEGITERDLALATQSPEGVAFRRGARLGPPQFVLTRDGLEVMRGSENQIWAWLHRNHSYSVDWALKYEGYAIVPARAAS